jgi:hypothetical protein
MTVAACTKSSVLIAAVKHGSTYNELVVCELNVCPDTLELRSNTLRIHQAHKIISVLSNTPSRGRFDLIKSPTDSQVRPFRGSKVLTK